MYIIMEKTYERGNHVHAQVGTKYKCKVTFFCSKVHIPYAIVLYITNNNYEFVVICEVDTINVLSLLELKSN